MSSQLQDALGMFAFLAIELSVLFIGISLLVGVLQRHIPPSKVEALLTSSGKRGYFLAAGLGAITPFCSCSTNRPVCACQRIGGEAHRWRLPRRDDARAAAAGSQAMVARQRANHHAPFGQGAEQDVHARCGTLHGQSRSLSEGRACRTALRSATGVLRNPG